MTTPVTTRIRLADLVAAVRGARREAARDRWTRTELEAHQRERLRALLAHARRHSALHRERLPASDALDALPTLDKATVLAHYDELLTDPRLSLARLEEHVATLADDVLLDREFRVMATGGTSGRRAVLPFSRAEWRAVMTGFFRWQALVERRPRPGKRIAAVSAAAPRHMSRRMAFTVDVGLLRVLPVDPARPMREAAPAVQAHRPAELIGYPSALALLAVEQLEGRLDIAPEYVATTSEVRTPEMARLIREAWGVEPFDCLAMTEAGIVAVDCPRHAGLHVLEDHVLLEVLDDDGAPVADGEPGRLVITPLDLRTLPLVRYETGDLVRATRERCACGRPSMRLLEVQGRQDDVLALEGAAGGTVRLHPIVVRGPLAAVPGLAQYQVVHDPAGLHVRMLLRAGADPAVAEDRVREALAAALAGAGARPLALDVEVVADGALARSAIGKHQIVVSRA